MQNKIKLLKKFLINNKLIIENYFFMTTLQMLNSFFYLLIYPYLIRRLGIEGYGLFAFATATAAYFIFLINFGFDLPAIKRVAENINENNVLSDILSNVFSAKTYIFLLSSFIFIVLIYTVPIMYRNKLIFSFCFVSTFSHVLFPQWFFQGIQQMKVVTYIQFGFKVISLPIIFLFINEKSDLELYVIITSLTTILGSIVAFLMLIYKYKINIRFVRLYDIQGLFKEAQPFFLSSLAFSIKEYSIPIIIGAFFGMKEVAVYDLANKLILVPRTLLLSVNAAIFPKLIIKINNSLLKRLIKIEFFVAVSVVLLIILFGKYIVYLMGGDGLVEAYYLSILLSITIVSFLVVGACNNFIFIPNNKHYFITKNQFFATASFFMICFGGIYFIRQELTMIGLAVALSALIEILYATYLIKKHKLLKVS